MTNGTRARGTSARRSSPRPLEQTQLVIVSLLYMAVVDFCTDDVVKFVARAAVEFTITFFLCFSMVRIFDDVVRWTCEMEADAA